MNVIDSSAVSMRFLVLYLGMVTVRPIQQATTAARALWFLDGSSSSSVVFSPKVRRHDHRRRRVYHAGDLETLYTNKLTSKTCGFPLDYDGSFPFVQAASRDKDNNALLLLESMNLGQWLQGDRIRPSTFDIEFQNDVYCGQLGITDLGRQESAKMARAIRLGYHHNWILDNLPAAYKTEDDVQMTTVFMQGFPVGFIATDYVNSGQQQQQREPGVYINNHVNIEITYTRDETTSHGYNIVQFVVQPFSIHHALEYYTDDRGQTRTRLINPIPSCDHQNNNNNGALHTTYEIVRGHEKQKASGNVLFTYDVIWKQDNNRPKTTWSNRWDAYLHGQNHEKATAFQWRSIKTKAIVLLLLALAVAALTNPWRAFCCRRACVSQKQQRHGHKEIQNYVFLRPVHYPFVLIVLCGTGAQLLVTGVVVLTAAAMGFAHPSMRGWFTMLFVFVFPFCGVAGGFVAGSLCRAFSKGTPINLQAASSSAFPSLRNTSSMYSQACERIQAFLMAIPLGSDNVIYATAFVFPSLYAVTFLLLQACAWVRGSTLVVPFWVILLLATGWLGFSPYMVFVGASFGTQRELIPPHMSPLDDYGQKIPKQPWYLSPKRTILVGGMIPHAVSTVELHMVLNIIWEYKVYDVYGFFCEITAMFLLATAMISVFFNQSQLSQEDYRWWWRSFLHGGAPAGFMALYMILYYTGRKTFDFAEFLYFLAFTVTLCTSIFVILGTVGLMASLHWNLRLYSRIESTSRRKQVDAPTDSPTV